MHDYVYFINRVLYVTAIVFLISSVDDFFIDAVYWLRRFYRRLFVREKIKPITLIELKNKPEQAIAVMVPAWKEHEVIAQMVETNSKFISYKNYIFFVGVYQNDPDTNHEVDRVVASLPNVKKVVVPHDGPTSKADCLNWIIQAIFLHEKKTGIDFAMIVMHDSEDVIHPFEFSMFNYLVPRKDLIQIPVRCLESDWKDFIRGSYIDEFSEFHTKDMVTREALVGIVPSAGVSTCFSRKAIEILCAENESQPFNTDTLTEDYDISYRLACHEDIKQIFVVFPVDVHITKELYNSAKQIDQHISIPIATAEYFPNRFVTAVRQKTRWNIGIFFQAAGQRTWRGGFFNKLYFFHDRKGIVVNLLMLPAYFLLANILILLYGRHVLGWPVYYFDIPPWLVYTNTALLFNRAFQRAYFSYKLYNWQQGLLSVPRIVVSNVINFCSTLRACYFYLRHKMTGIPIAWDKTTHEYPSLQVLERNFKHLGAMLIDEKVIDENQLANLLEEQKITRVPLGRLLTDKGLLSEERLRDFLISQTGYARGTTDGIDALVAMTLLPPSIMVEDRIIPVKVTESKGLELLTSRSLSPEVTERILDHGYTSVDPRLVLDRELLPLLSQVGHMAMGKKRLGDILVEKEVLTFDQLAHLLAEANENHRTLGGLVIEKGLIDPNSLTQLLSDQMGLVLGDPSKALPPEEATKILNPIIMTCHRIYPVQNTGHDSISVFSTNEVSEAAQAAINGSGFRKINVELIFDEDMDHLLAKINQENVKSTINT